MEPQYWFFAPSSKLSLTEVTKFPMKRVILSLILALVSIGAITACNQPRVVRQTPVVYYDLSGRPYYVDEYGSAYYLDNNGGYTTIVVPPTAVYHDNYGQPMFVDPRRQAGSTETVNYPRISPQPRVTTVPAARQNTVQPSTQPVTTVPAARQQAQPQQQEQQRVNTVPAARQPAPPQGVPQSRVSTVPQVRTTTPAPAVRTVPSVRTVPPSRKP